MKRTKWTFEKLQAEALKYDTRTEFRNLNQYAHQLASKMNIIEQICSHMKEQIHLWTNKELEEEALKYKTRQDFHKNNDRAYRAALDRGILDNICVHMEYVLYPWSNEELLSEALKYNNRIDFYKSSSRAYHTAVSRNILDQICSHMKRSRSSSQQELELMAILKESFPDLMKKNFKVSIPGKPHMHRFQVDILDPNSKLGIEFDGPYHHSDEYMVKSKTKIGWTVEEALAYHEIKDAAVLDCHGVTLLHIKWDDWISDKQACIQKCLDFLGIKQEKEVA